MSQSDRTLLTIPGSDVSFEEVDLPLRARRREGIGRLALLASDAIAVTVSLLLVAVLTDARFTPWVAVLVPLYALVAKMAGLYDRDQFVLLKTTLDEAPTLVAVAAIFALVIEGGRALEFTGRSHPFLLWGMLTGVLIVARAVARFVVVRTTDSERILVVGDAATTAMLERKLAADPGLNAEVIGRVSVEPGRGEDEKLLGTVEDLPDVLRAHRVERAIVAPTREGTDIADVIRLATVCGVRVSVLPRMLEVIGTSVEFDDLGGRPLLGVRGFGLSPSSRVLKRCFDLVVATSVVIVLAPFLLVVVIAVKLSSPGAGHLPPDADRPRRERVPDVEVPHDGARRRRAKAGAARGQRGRTALQDRRRPEGHAGGPLPPAAFARRAAPAHQRASAAT